MKYILLIFNALLLTPSYSFAADSARTTNRFGVLITGQGIPAPSIAGVDLALNVTSFLRLDAGIGGYNNEFINTPRVIYNYSLVPAAYLIVQAVKPIFFGFAWLMNVLVQSMTTFSVQSHLVYSNFWSSVGTISSMQTNYLSTQSLFSYGAGGQLFVPNWDISPTIGTHWASFSASNVSNLPNQGSQIYYTLGMNIQTMGGFSAEAGINFCPTLANQGCGFYGSVGVFF